MKSKISAAVNGWFKESGLNAGICDFINEKWTDNMTTSQVLDIAIANVGFCMRWPEITNENMAKLFPVRELHNHHIYINNDTFKIKNPGTDVVLFGNASGDITIDSDEKIINIWLRDNSSAKIHIGGNALVNIDTLDDDVNVEVDSGSKRLTKVFKYKGTVTVSGNAVIRDKTGYIF